MAIYLVQHGKSMPKEVNPERPLSKEGIKESEKLAGFLKDSQCLISKIYHSGKLRTQQTAEIFSQALGTDQGPEPLDGLNPNDDVVKFAGKLDSSSNIMYVGHLPFMERLVSQLICGQADKLLLKFQNSGIVCLERDPKSEAWFIKWTLFNIEP